MIVILGKVINKEVESERTESGFYLSGCKKVISIAHWSCHFSGLYPQTRKMQPLRCEWSLIPQALIVMGA